MQIAARQQHLIPCKCRWPNDNRCDDSGSTLSCQQLSNLMTQRRSGAFWSNYGWEPFLMPPTILL